MKKIWRLEWQSNDTRTSFVSGNTIGEALNRATHLGQPHDDELDMEREWNLIGIKLVHEGDEDYPV